MDTKYSYLYQLASEVRRRWHDLEDDVEFDEVMADLLNEIDHICEVPFGN